MKILAIDKCGAALDWYMRCQEAGHKVKVWISKDKTADGIGVGLIDRVDDWRPHVDWCDMVFMADNTKYLDAADELRERGKCVVGPTKASADWELDRGIGQDVLEKCGIDTIPSEVFSSYDKAIAYVKKHDKRFVSKPSGDADKALSYVANSTEDMVFMLERWKAGNKLKGDFILQEFIPGIEFAVGGWFGPGGFNHGWCENFEFKKFMNDEKGPQTGEMGTVIKYVSNSKLAEELLLPLEKELQKTGHSGYVDVSAIIDDDGVPWPLEFTMRPGYPLFCLQQELHEGDPAEWLYDLAEGMDAGNVILDRVATCVVMAIPEFPYSHLTGKDVCGIPIYGLEQPLAPCYHPCEVQAGTAPHKVQGKIVNKKCLVTGGDYVVVVSGTGDTVSKSAKEAYKNLKNIEIPNSVMYRTDIGDRIKNQLPELQKHGYAKGWRF